MLKRKLIPTPLVDLSVVPAIAITEPVPSHSFHTVRVAIAFLRYSLGNLWLRLAGRLTDEVAAVRFRQTLESLGGLWIKLGQLLSLRSDAFSKAMCDELSRLHYRAVGFPPSLARSLLETELGRPIDEVFEVFDDTPIAAASICQVHRAILRRRHRPVVVKIQRPDAQASFARDMGVLRTLVRLVELLGFSTHVRWRDALWEMEQIALEETDYRYEASNVRRMRKHLKEHRIYAPKVYQRYCTQRVLVLEYIDGVLLSDFIHHLDKDPLRMQAWLCANNIDPVKVGRRLFFSAMRQVLEDNCFHGDLHPGNVVLLKDSRLALIDFGTIGSVDLEFLEHYKQGLNALAARDYAKAADYTLRMCDELPLINLAELRAELVRCYRRWEAKTRLKGMPYHERSMGASGSDSGKIMYAHGVNMTFAFMKVSRTWMTLDAALNYLMPNANYVELFGKHFAAANSRNMTRASILAGVKRSLDGLKNTAEELNLLVAPMIRRHTLVFQGTSSKLSRFVATLCRLTVLALFIYGVMLLHLFLNQHHGSWFADHSNPLLERVIATWPKMGYGWWVMILTGFVLVGVMLWRSSRMLEAKEYERKQ